MTVTATGLEFPLRWIPDWLAALTGDDPMTSRVASQETTQGYEDVIVGAQSLFKMEGWRIADQSARTTTFVGRPRIPWLLVALTAAGMLALIVPGVLFYRLMISKRYGLSNIVVLATPVRGGTHVAVEYAPPAEGLAQQFMESLPAKQ